jgi:hypothetical protein
MENFSATDKFVFRLGYVAIKVAIEECGEELQTLTDF